MEATQTSSCPFSPFMWDLPVQSMPALGSKLGRITDLELLLQVYDFNFDIIVRECLFHSSCFVQSFVENHPLHTYALNKHQFDLLRYGMVLDTEKRLVLMEVPRHCADSGVTIKREYASVVPLHMRNEVNPCQKHSIFSEYNLVVAQLPSDDDIALRGDGRVEPRLLFRLLFRNEAYQELLLPNWSDIFPLFRLRGVYVSHDFYEIFQDVQHNRLAYKRETAAEADSNSAPAADRPFESSTGVLLCDHSVAASLCDMWVSVLNGILPVWAERSSVESGAASILLSPGAAPPDVVMSTSMRSPEKENEELIPRLKRRLCLNYSTNGERLRHRIDIIPRSSGILQKWRSGAFDVSYHGINHHSSEVTEPELLRARCARMILRTNRSERNYIEEDELCAFKPFESEYCDKQLVYCMADAECLRLWILKGLMSAEIAGIHAVLLEVDPSQLLSQCVGLLWGDPDNMQQRSGEGKFHVCKIVLETIEDYLQHSGVVWKVVVAACEERGFFTTQICRDILEVIHSSKTRMEMEERESFTRAEAAVLMESETHGASAPRGEGCDGFTVVVTAGDEANSDKNGQLLPASYTAAVSFPRPVKTFFQPTVSIGITEQAERVGLKINDASLYPLFRSLCKPRKETVPVKQLVQLLLQKLNDGCGITKKKCCLDGHSLLVLDHCGVPCDVTRVTQFVMSFSGKRSLVSLSKDLCGNSSSDEEPALNYLEFSMMMLAFAYQ